MVKRFISIILICAMLLAILTPLFVLLIDWRNTQKKTDGYPVYPVTFIDNGIEFTDHLGITYHNADIKNSYSIWGTDTNEVCAYLYNPATNSHIKLYSTFDERFYQAFGRLFVEKGVALPAIQKDTISHLTIGEASISIDTGYSETTLGSTNNEEWIDWIIEQFYAEGIIESDIDRQTSETAFCISLYPKEFPALRHKMYISTCPQYPNQYQLSGLKDGYTEYSELLYTLVDKQTIDKLISFVQN